MCALAVRRKVWIVGYYGTVPSEGQRAYRAYLLGKALAERGYLVKWWISSFSHTSKKTRETSAATSDVAGLEIVLVPAPPYSSNISWRRAFSEREFAKNFEAMAARDEPPGTVILLEPARFFGDAVARLAKRTGARFVVDIVDLWPELFEMVFPRGLRWMARPFLSPLYRQRNRLIRQAAALVGVTRDYVDEVANLSGFSGPKHVAYWGSQPTTTGQPNRVPSSIRDALEPMAPNQLLVAYLGALGPSYDMETLVASARTLSRPDNIRWVVAGAGPMAELMRLTENELGPQKFLFLGLQPPEVIDWILKRIHVGLCCYREASTVSMPIKAFDYLSHGVPIVSSLGRELGRVVAEDGVGLRYVAGDSQSLSSAVTRLCTDETFRTKCAQNAAIAGARYDSQQQHREYARFLIEQKLVPD